jgi:hypothetical protein
MPLVDHLEKTTTREREKKREENGLMPIGQLSQKE